MSAERDHLLDRRRLKRKLGMWQAGALLLLAVLVIVGVSQIWTTDQPHIARITVDGMIGDNYNREKVLADLAENKNAKAVIVRVNSPGGTVAGSEALYNGLMGISENKPTAAFIGTIGASGGYITALATDRIFARKNALTGSIGIIFQAPEISGLLEKVGIGIQEVKSSPLKGGPSMYEPMSDDQREIVLQMIDDSNEWFIDLVSERREMERDIAADLADGRVFTGGRALGLNLIDEVGGELTAINWLRDHEDMPENLPVVDYSMVPTPGVFGQAMAWLGLDGYANSSLSLDGLLALWQPK